MGSVFTSRVIETIDIPHDAGQTVNIRKLAPRQLEQAAKEAQRRSIADLKELRASGGADFIKDIAAMSTNDKPAVADPLLQFDRLTLMVKGIQSWSYDVERTEETIADLDEPTQEVIARAILKLSRPDLFRTADETEAAQKNG